MILTALLTLAALPAAQAESDLCTYGWQRNVNNWLAKPTGLPQIFCGKDARKAAKKAVTPIKDALTRDGYHVTSGPDVHEIQLSKHPNWELVAAINATKCPRSKKQLQVIYAVCVSIQEGDPSVFSNGKPLPRPDPATAKHYISGAVPAR